MHIKIICLRFHIWKLANTEFRSYPWRPGFYLHKFLLPVWEGIFCLGNDVYIMECSILRSLSSTGLDAPGDLCSPLQSSNKALIKNETMISLVPPLSKVLQPQRHLFPFLGTRAEPLFQLNWPTYHIGFSAFVHPSLFKSGRKQTHLCTRRPEQ
jgi:hypothetical protein